MVMARVDLQCSCGHGFFVRAEDLSAERTASCPACDAPVKASGPVKAGAEKGVPRPAVPLHDAFNPAPAPRSKKKLYLLLGGIAAALVLVGVVLALVSSGPAVDYEKEAAKAVAARKKAFE